jgi:dolichol kinase
MSLGDLIQYIELSLLFGAVFAAIEVSKRKFNLPTEIMRRVAHISSGLLVIIDYLVLPAIPFVVMITSGGVLFLVLSRLNLFSSINNVQRHTFGQYVLTFGYLSAYLISLNKPEIFIPTVLILSFADALAGLYGTLTKAKNRTVLGSVVFFIISLVILLSTGTQLLPALVIATSVTLVERVTPLGFDNVTVPLATALLLLAF